MRALETGYAQAYRSAAQVLFEAASNNPGHYLEFPIVFLYRHYTELVIKNIVRRFLHLLSRDLTKDEQRHLNGHRLDALWSDLKRQVKEVNQLHGLAWLPALEEGAVDNYIEQLTSFDQISMNFRY